MEDDKKILAECFWLEINKAIVNSQSVKDCLLKLKDEGLLEYLTRHDYIVDGRLLIKRILDEPNNARAIESEATEASNQINNDVTKRLTKIFEFSKN